MMVEMKNKYEYKLARLKFPLYSTVNTLYNTKFKK